MMRPSSISATTTRASVLEPRLMVKAPAIGQVSIVALRRKELLRSTSMACQSNRPAACASSV
jgi:hypothetical protein